MEILGYFAAILIGVSLGLIGGGGSILTIPVLVYLFEIDAVLATGYSLFVVGTTALVGGIKAKLRHEVNLKTGIVFALPSFVTIFLTRRFLVPAIPEIVYQTESITVTKSATILTFFALLMLAAAVSMIRNKKAKVPKNAIPPNYYYPVIVLEGAMLGVVTGLVGAGGGFLIIPALVLLAKLPMKTAVGTSLFIIAANSLIGFAGDLGAAQEIDWTFLLTITSIAMVGIFIGSYWGKIIDGKKLKTGFGWFVIIMAAYILLRVFLM